MTQEDIDIKRAKRQQEKRAKKALIKLVIFAVYLSALYSISYLERDVRSFNYKSSIENYLDSSGNGKEGFSSVNVFFKTIFNGEFNLKILLRLNLEFVKIFGNFLYR